LKNRPEVSHTCVLTGSLILLFFADLLFLYGVGKVWQAILDILLAVLTFLLWVRRASHKDLFTYGIIPLAALGFGEVFKAFCVSTSGTLQFDNIRGGTISALRQLGWGTAVFLPDHLCSIPIKLTVGEADWIQVDITHDAFDPIRGVSST